MSIKNELKSALFSLGDNNQAFEELALEVFRYQYFHNDVYKQYVDALGRKYQKINRIDKIPCLPISFFKKYPIRSEAVESKVVFESSGTTGSLTSRHHVSDLRLYEANSKRIFDEIYGPLTDYHIFALLPSYLERKNSSLVFMVEAFINATYSNFSGFYLDNLALMVQKIREAAATDSRKILLIGVSFALLDLAENTKLAFKLKEVADKLSIMETGGMKGRRKELLREELHFTLKAAFGLEQIHSEYGMTELLSQAYAPKDGLFKSPHSMRALIREVNDPFSYFPYFKIGKNTEKKQPTGGLNIIDLCNIDSCSFIETQDLAQFSADYSHFKVIGRFDSSDLRGCNLLVN